jgi:multiple sugar transport system permease protein
MVLGTAIASIGREYWEMASLEGARPIWRFVHVTLPGIRRSLIAVLLLNAALGSQVFDLVYVTTGGGPGYATMLLPIDMYGRAFGGKAGQGAAVAVVQVLLGLLFAALAVLLLGKHEESMDAGTPYAGTTQSRTATIALFAILLLFALPLLWLLPATVQSGRSFALAGTSLSPAHWTLSNVQSVLSAGMGGAVVTSFLLALAVVAGAIALGVPAAFALSALLHSGPVRAIVLGLFLIGLLQPTQVLIIPLFAMLRDLDLLDSPLGIILPEVARLLPFTVLLLWGFLAQSPREVFEAARIDGASAFQEMRSIAVPLIRPALAAAGIWAFVSSWNEYLLPTIVSQDGGIVTVPTLLASFIGKFDTQFGALAAGAVLALLPSLLIYGALGRVAGRGVSRVERGLR